MELLRDFGMKLNRILKNKKRAFTLAEVVIVMGILGVMMAAFAPVVTKKTLAVGANSFRNFNTANGHVGMAYGTVGDSKTVLIGDTEIADDAEYTPKLLITNNNANLNNISAQIAFATYNPTSATRNYHGQLLLDGNSNIFLGGLSNENLNITNKTNFTAIGLGACTEEEVNPVDNVICLGSNAGMPTTTTAASNRIYFGDKTEAYSGSNIFFGTTTLDSLAGGTTCTKADGSVVESSVCVGEGAGGNNPSSDTLYLGDTSKNYAMNKIYFGDKTLYWYFQELLSNLSDIRLKNVGKEFTGGLNEINQLEFYNYTYKRDAEKDPKVGVMAQDLQKVFPNAVKENKDGYLYIRKDEMFYAALNAIKELGKMFTTSDEKIKALEERNAMLEEQNKELQDLYIELSKRVEKLDKKKTKGKLTITPTKVDEETDETTVNADVEDSNN